MAEDFNGKADYTAALKLVASGEANTKEGADKAIQLLKAALRDGISPSDQAMAYKTMGDKYVFLDDIQSSYSSIKQALTIKRTLIVSEEEEKAIWSHAYDMMGMVAANIEPDDADGGIRLYKEVIEFTDHPRAHVNIGVLFAQNNDKEQACQHWEYVVNNEGKLKKYESYQKERESAVDNLKIAQKPATKEASRKVCSDGAGIRGLSVWLRASDAFLKVPVYLLWNYVVWIIIETLGYKHDFISAALVSIPQSVVMGLYVYALCNSGPLHWIVKKLSMIPWSGLILNPLVTLPSWVFGWPAEKAYNLFFYKYSCLAMGLDYLQKGEFVKAVFELSKAKVSKNDKEGQKILHSALADAYEELEDYDKAITEYETAIQYDPESSTLKMGLAYCLTMKNDFDRALRLFREIIQASPENTNARLGISRCYISMKMFAEALACLKETLSIEPQNATAHKMLDEVHMASGNEAEALKEAQLSLALNPEPNIAKEAQDINNSIHNGHVTTEPLDSEPTDFTDRAVSRSPENSICEDSIQKTPKKISYFLKIAVASLLLFAGWKVVMLTKTPGREVADKIQQSSSQQNVSNRQTMNSKPVINNLQRNEKGVSTGQSQNSSAESVIIPNHHPGDKYIVESLYLDTPKLNNTTERKITLVNSDKLVTTSININSKNKSVRTLEFTREWNLIRTRNADGGGVDFSPPLKYYDFPLYPGKSWKQTSVENNIKTGAIKEHTLSGVVGGWENISVPAGTFKALKITVNSELLDNATGQKSTGTDISWYVPELRRSVKSETASRNSEGIEERQQIQLKQYELN